MIGGQTCLFQEGSSKSYTLLPVFVCFGFCFGFFFFFFNFLFLFLIRLYCFPETQNYHHHHYHQIVLILSLSLSLSLSLLASVPISHHSLHTLYSPSSVCRELMYVSFCCRIRGYRCVWVHRKTSHMSSFLLPQYILFVFLRQFGRLEINNNKAVELLDVCSKQHIAFLCSSPWAFSLRFSLVEVVQRYSNSDTATTWKRDQLSTWSITSL